MLLSHRKTNKSQYLSPEQQQQQQSTKKKKKGKRFCFVALSKSQISFSLLECLKFDWFLQFECLIFFLLVRFSLGLNSSSQHHTHLAHFQSKQYAFAVERQSYYTWLFLQLFIFYFLFRLSCSCWVLLLSGMNGETFSISLLWLFYFRTRLTSVLKFCLR